VVPREDAVRERAVCKWAALQELDLARVSNAKMGRGFFLMNWRERKLVSGGPDGTLEELEQYLRGNVAVPQKNVPIPQAPVKPKRRMFRRYRP
jgi:hypothetical protein